MEQTKQLELRIGGKNEDLLSFIRDEGKGKKKDKEKETDLSDPATFKYPYRKANMVKILYFKSLLDLYYRLAAVKLKFAL